MTIEFTITTTPLGIASGLEPKEIVRAGDYDDFKVTEGVLIFVVSEKIIMYAQGTWALVSSKYLKE
jgi:hypothetical protein